MKVKFNSLFFACLLLTPPFASAQNFLEKKTVAIGEAVEDFELAGLSGKSFKLSDFKGKVVMIHFWSATCPFVVRYEGRLQAITKDYEGRGVKIVGIASNVTETPDEIRKEAQRRGLPYDILLDPGHPIADRLGALTTPHVFIIDSSGVLIYEGAVDDQGWDEKNEVRKNYARDALEAVLSGSAVPNPTTKTVGCTVKRALR